LFIEVVEVGEGGGALKASVYERYGPEAVELREVENR
jgi:hypothetical protein